MRILRGIRSIRNVVSIWSRRSISRKINLISIRSIVRIRSIKSI